MVESVQTYFVDSVVVGELQINCYIFGCSKTMEAAIIDPGGDPDAIFELVDSLGAKVKMILLTHGHFDHLGGLNAVKARYGCPVLIHAADEETLTNPMMNLSALTGQPISCDPADQILVDGDRIAIGSVALEVMHTPGHTAGSVSFAHNEIVFGGDLLFFGSIGRTDLPGGSFEEIEHSIKARIYTMPDDTIIYPGHGEPTTVGYEKMHNQFVRQ